MVQMKTLVGLAALVACVGSANAGLVTDWDFTVSGSGGSTFVASANPGSWTANVLPNGDTVIEGEFDAGDWFIDFNLVFNNDPTVNSSYNLTNRDGTQTFNVLTRQGSLNNPAAVFMRGSVVGGVTDNTLLPEDPFGDGAILSADGANPIYRAIVDGVSVRTLGDPFGGAVAGPLETGDFGPLSFGIPVFEIGPGVNMGMAVRNQFTLTGGEDVASIQNTFVKLIPAPGMVGFMGIAGLAAARRRR